MKKKNVAVVLFQMKLEFSNPAELGKWHVEVWEDIEDANKRHDILLETGRVSMVRVEIHQMLLAKA